MPAYVFMIDTFHEDKLSVRPLGMGLILKRPTQLFNGDVSLQDLIISGAEKQNVVKASGVTGELQC